MKLKEALNTKSKIHDKINSITDFHAIWEHDPESKACRLVIEGVYMEKGKKQSGLAEADKEWIANLVVTSIQTAIKPIQEDISEIKNRLTNIENRLEAIENCSTIKKELSKK